MGPNLQVGQLVYSKAGRDRGRPFLVWEIISDRRIALVDGKLRRVVKPKIKNTLHVQAASRMAQDIAAKRQKGEPVSDAEVRRAIARLLGEE
ncbi:MAG: KOW domain-containing RNA-binding protein [Thermoanaerobacteraceae bacterium]|nr:KOW domain-containing RNA-binding protein [Thermoanaerobacteraceae bacterium]